MNLLTVSGSPHIASDLSVKKIMYGVVFAMLPALMVSTYFFGFGAIIITLASIISCLAVEYLIQKFIMKQETTITDGSAIVTGILLAFNLPTNLPIWMIVVGAIVSIGIAKMSFGGLGKNPFNPALVGRVFLLISFPVEMTSWPKPDPAVNWSTLDAITGPTPLAIIKEGGTLAEVPAYMDMLIGRMGGSMGEISAIALLIGAAYLLIRKIITWHIPTAYLGSVIVFTGILYLIDPTVYIDPIFHLITGGMMLGVFFMATDMVTSPMSAKGQLVFGLGCGILTILIRVFGAYPEGVSFAILIMNAFVPIINNSFKPRRFGEIIK